MGNIKSKKELVEEVAELGSRLEELERNEAGFKKVEEALQAQMQRNELILRTSREGFWICDSDGNIHDVNDSYCRMIGYSREELLTMKIADVEASENPQEVQAHINQIIETGYDSFETRHRRKDGTFIYIDISASLGDMDGERFFFVFFRDITERKRAEEVIRESEEKFRSLAEQSPNMIFINKEGRIVYVNKICEEITGYTREETYSCDFDFLKLIAPHSLDLVKENFKRHLEDMDVPPYEYTMITKAGKRIEAINSCKLIRYEGQTAILGIVTDITERKKVEEALLESEEKYYALFHQSANSMLLTDLESLKIVEFNDSTHNNLGYTREEFEKLEVPDFEIIESAEEIKTHVQALIETGSDTFETKHRTKSGEIRDVIVNNKVINLRGKFYSQSIFTDITNLKRAEEALQESEEKYRIVIETSIDTIYQLNLEGNVTFMNNAGAKMYGYEPEEIIGMNFSSLTPEDRLFEGYAIVKKVLLGQTVQGEAYVKHKKGHEFPIHFSMAPVIKGDKVVGFAGVSRDITERKLAEQELLEHRAQLKSLASQLAVTEERERYRLAQELHDRVGQSLVLSKLKLDRLRHSPEAGDLVKTLAEVSNGLEQVIDETMKLMFDMSYPVLYELGFEKAVAEWLEDEIGIKHGIETEFEDDGREKPLGDDIRALLFRNVRELLTNIVEHAQAHKVKVSVGRVDEYICVSVEDDGVGFDPVKIKSAASNKGKFGLFSIRERLEQLGGSFEIKSEAGSGSEITMTAPLKQG